MTFTELKQAVKDRLNLSSTEADTRIGIEINDHYRRITSSLGINTTRRTQVSAAASPPSTSMTFNGVERVINVIDHATTPYRVLKEVTVEEIRAGEPWNQSTPDHYAILVSGSSSVTILMNCVPTTPFTLYADGLTSLSDLSGSQVPALPASFHDILKHGALADEYRKMEKVRLAEDAQMQYERRLSDLRMFLAKSAMRDDYQGKTAYGPLGQSGGAGGGGSAGTRLDQIDNPIASKTFEMAGYNLELHYGTGRFVVSGGATPPPEIRVALDGYSSGHLQSVNTEVLWLSRNISYDGVGQNLDDINEYGLALATNIDVADSGVRGWRYLSFTPGANPRSSNLRHFLKETGGADHYGTPVLISAPYATVAVRNGAYGPSTATARLSQFADNWGYFGLNLDYAGEWNLDDTSKYGMLATLQEDGSVANFAIYTASPGANPRTLTQRFNVDNNGYITNFGGQIKFPAAQAASSDANTLDDYEEGTWTPTIEGNTGGSGQSYTLQVGHYTKVGNIVHARAYVQLSNKGTVTGTYLLIKGLPFTASSATNSHTAASVSYFTGMNTASWYWLGAYVEPGSTWAFVSGTTGASAAAVYPSSSEITNTTAFIATFTYRV